MKTKILRILTTTSNTIASLPLRLALGSVMIAHGGQKLFGWWGGYGLEGTAQFFEQLGLTPGYLMALLAGGTEFIAGALILAGLFTRVAAALLAFVMAVGIVTVHSSGFFLPTGMEYALTLLLISISLLVTGGGAWSLDRKLASK